MTQISQGHLWPFPAKPILGPTFTSGWTVLVAIFPTPPNLCRRFAAAEVRRSEGVGRWRRDPRAKARG
jgi:hypothetical protein